MSNLNYIKHFMFNPQAQWRIECWYDFLYNIFENDIDFRRGEWEDYNNCLWTRPFWMKLVEGEKWAAWICKRRDKAWKKYCKHHPE